MKPKVARVLCAAALFLPVGASAQDVIYSQPGPNGTYQRYEQYGYGANAQVRLRSSSSVNVPTRMRLIDPWTGLTAPVYSPATIDEEHERLGPAPAFGTFAGRLVNSQGPDPAGLYRGLGVGTRERGQITTVTPPFATAAPVPAVSPPPGARVRGDRPTAAGVFTPALPAPPPPPPAPAAVVPPPPPPRLGPQ